MSKRNKRKKRAKQKLILGNLFEWVKEKKTHFDIKFQSNSVSLLMLT